MLDRGHTLIMALESVARRDFSLPVKERMHLVRAIGSDRSRVESVRSSNALVRDYYDDPSATPRDALRSDACITVPSGWTPSGELELREIRGGRDAVTLHVGPYAELELAYKWLYGRWLPQHGEELADAPCVEEYLNDARTPPAPELRTEIWLALR